MENRRFFLRQLGCGLFAAGFPALFLPKETTVIPLSMDELTKTMAKIREINRTQMQMIYIVSWSYIHGGYVGGGCVTTIDLREVKRLMLEHKNHNPITTSVLGKFPIKGRNRVLY